MYFDRIGHGFSKDNLSRDLEIDMNKKFSQTISEVRAKTKDSTCFCCGKTVSSFCNSHDVPKFCLESIEKNGKVTGPNAILGLPSMGISIGKEKIGLNEAGTFRIICRECDSRQFSDYENPDNYSDTCSLTQKMMAQIAMKNYLKFISKRKIEIAIMENTLDRCPQNDILHMELEQRIKTSKVDLKTYIDDFNIAKKKATKEYDNGYFIIYYNLLNYVAPIAVQIPISLIIDIYGGIVNDILNMDPNYYPADLHLCVFPLKDRTAVILFINEGEKRYKNFYKQFRKLNDCDKLGIINYLIFLYSEDFFLDYNIEDKVDLSKFYNTVSLTPAIWTTNPIAQTDIYSDTFSLSNWKCIPNLLSEQFKVR